MVRYCRANDNRADTLRARGSPGVNVWIAPFLAIERRSSLAR
jgi:hypothetical protein